METLVTGAKALGFALTLRKRSSFRSMPKNWWPGTSA